MYFKDKRILVIGGTGTIGKSIVRYVLEDDPAEIIIFSRDEYKQFQMQHEWDQQANLTFVLGDVRDYDRVSHAMKGVDYVFHLAAMKHVASCETNPQEAILTNVKGTYHVINAALAHEVEKVVFTSSDKAISPTNTYGATKLIAERLMTATELRKGKSKTIFSSVRFGNVIGSRGSVIPLFKKQIIEQQRITVTDSQMTRFMMTLTQATELTIQALKESKGGEVFVLKMPVILLGDLASLVIEETCRTEQMNENNVTIREIGLRPGEKMYEELMTFDESLTALELPDMYVLPGNNKSSYPGARQAQNKTYSSIDQTPISYKELRKLLKNENII
ncbi:SDR family NAD(P)-dependent oxidoreductase [Halobacillus sp. Marseille-P3879]|uniref:SDR family NAD(P)-dependent oxidoreductase n=1 Tax=Halobacillus sp. Marseille-P3879 TaxID=2045014 RepID=UPI000C7B4D62|nr:SDR family NAD(P)-dependent oxidoreductase [Halobacillus sp. Marseille-P3879]